MKTKLTPLSKFLIVLVILGGLAFVLYKTNLIDIVAPKGAGSGSDKSLKGEKVIRIGVVTWGGYAGGELFNEGFAPTKDSRFYKDYGFMVDR